MTALDRTEVTPRPKAGRPARKRCPPGDWRARAVLVAPCPLTGPPVLHLPGRTGWTRCGKPVPDEWATTTAVPDDPRHCRPCTRSER